MAKVKIKQRLDTGTEFGQFLVTPHLKALKKSVYHK